MDWPARSPDLNPVEHVWDILGRRIRQLQHPPQTIQELDQALIREWQAIPQATLRRLIRSMTTRCRECVRARGGHTHYWKTVWTVELIFEMKMLSCSSLFSLQFLGYSDAIANDTLVTFSNLTDILCFFVEDIIIQYYVVNILYFLTR